MLVTVSPLLRVVPDWRVFLKGGIQEKEYHILYQHERTGRPRGGESFIDTLEVLLGIRLRKKKAGPKGQWKNRENK